MAAKKIEEPNEPIPYLQAYLNLQGDLEALTKDADNPFFKSSYVPLPSMLTAIKPALQKNGFILTQPVEYLTTEQGLKTVVISRIIYVHSGQGNEAKIVLPVIDDMQKLGGAITYARRYSLSALLGLAEKDDDGNTATGKDSVARSATSPKKGKKTVNLEDY